MRSNHDRVRNAVTAALLLATLLLGARLAEGAENTTLRGLTLVAVPVRQEPILLPYGKVSDRPISPGDGNEIAPTGQVTPPR